MHTRPHKQATQTHTQIPTARVNAHLRTTKIALHPHIYQQPTCTPTALTNTPHAHTHHMHQQRTPTPTHGPTPAFMHACMHTYMPPPLPLPPLTGPNTNMRPHTHIDQVTICKHTDDIEITAHAHPPTPMHRPTHQAHGPRQINIKPEQ
jgi:hypothetical protein